MRKLGADRWLLTVSTLYFYANCLGIIYTWRQQETKLLDRGLLCKGQLLTQRLTPHSVFSLTDPRMKPLCRGRCRVLTCLRLSLSFDPLGYCFLGSLLFPLLLCLQAHTLVHHSAARSGSRSHLSASSRACERHSPSHLY